MMQVQQEVNSSRGVDQASGRIYLYNNVGLLGSHFDDPSFFFFFF